MDNLEGDHEETHRDNKDGRVVDTEEESVEIAVKDDKCEEDVEIPPTVMDILTFLKNKGVRVYIIDSEICETIPDIIESVHGVIEHVTKASRMPPSLNQPRKANRCLLYKDKAGRFYNLTLPPYTTSAASLFQSYLETFSGVQALGILVVLCRSFPCAIEGDVMVETFQPAFLGALIGLVFMEEIGLSWLNTAMFIRGMPSISAYSLTTNFETDWIRKLLIFCFYLASATAGTARLILILAGISMTCMVILANLGARAWGFMGRRPVRFGGLFEPILSYAFALIVGLAVPYLAFRETQGTRRVAIKGAIKNAFLVAGIFVASDYNNIQRYLVMGSETCDQRFVNVGVGAWWTCSLLFSIIMIIKLPPKSQIPAFNRPLLDEDHASPVGFKVPSLSDFPVDPILAEGTEDHGAGSVMCELVGGTFFALVGGVAIFFLAFSDSEYFT